VKRPFRAWLASLSALVLILSFVLWTLSYASPSEFRDSDSLQMDWTNGRLQFQTGRMRWVASEREARKVWSAWLFCGFGYFHGPPLQASHTNYDPPFTPGYVLEERVLAVPFWFLVMLAAPYLCMFAVSEFGLYKRRSIGRCKRCGYDLRATPNHCPECGLVPSGGLG
jgi:hypothetical protein